MYGYIYLILNKVNGKTYVGKKKLYRRKWNEDNYMGSGKRLKSAQKKYGIENFSKFLIQYCKTKEELDLQEIFWISEYRRRNKAEYNIANGGSGFICFHTEETKKRLYETHKGKEPWNKGKNLPEKYKRRLSETMKGKMKNAKKAYELSGRKDWNTFLKEYFKDR